MSSLYHKIKMESDAKAGRILAREILERNNGDVSKAAKILGISRLTVRRARDGNLEDESKAPKSIKNKTSFNLESIVIEEGKKTGYRYRRLTNYIYRKYALRLNENTVKAILKRNDVKRKRIRSKNGNVRHLYDYEHLEPFAELQVDTKYVIDEKTLPEDVCRHIRKHNLPLFEFNAIDAKTRSRFTAYSYELNSTFGFSFIMFVVMWLRLNGVRVHIKIRVDNGSEFFSGSERKKEEWNNYLSLFDAEIYAIPPKAKHLQALVENSHRHDDESFLIIHAIRAMNKGEFIDKAQRWQDTWNIARSSFGIGMNGLSPYEKLKDLNTFINLNIYSFPVLLMEDILKAVGTGVEWLSKLNYLTEIINMLKLRKSGKYVHTTCQCFTGNIFKFS